MACILGYFLLPLNSFIPMILPVSGRVQVEGPGVPTLSRFSESPRNLLIKRLRELP